MSKRWFDCNGIELHDGDIIRDVNSGREERVYACHPKDDPDNVSLGVNASNEAFLELHPGWEREIYPFDEFYYTTKEGKTCLVDFEKVVQK